MTRTWSFYVILIVIRISPRLQDILLATNFINRTSIANVSFLAGGKTAYSAETQHRYQFTNIYSRVFKCHAHTVPTPFSSFATQHTTLVMRHTDRFVQLASSMK